MAGNLSAQERYRRASEKEWRDRRDAEERGRQIFAASPAMQAKAKAEDDAFWKAVRTYEAQMAAGDKK